MYFFFLHRNGCQEASADLSWRAFHSQLLLQDPAGVSLCWKSCVYTSAQTTQSSGPAE